MNNAPPEPELPARVPEKRDAVTPDLPPADPSAPGLPDTEAGRLLRHSHEEATREEGELPAAGPGNAEPQEPTD
ncbi:hypothetical protein [Streptomyces xanthophaeus]|uniref:hypothetical protein n=1 Tax=Streptomyces xanthophaeus TaxID=67385 RepID=UPI002647DFB7|nr:hypothetical protein [Streptomyces xanthophaeus]WKD31216.1 hypothetical protein KO717_04060 [Streptomyces xanthophaeus]